MLKKTLNITFSVISGLIFLLAIYIMVFGTIARKQNRLLTFFGYSFSVVPTDSMEGGEPDSIKAGSFIITKNTPFDKIVEEDIIVFQDEGILKVHRVIKITNDGLVTKGDNPNVSEDPRPTTIDNYQARVVRSFGFLGLGAHIPGFQLIILFLLMIFLFILLIAQVIKIIKVRHEEKVEKIKEEYNNKE